MWGVVYERDVVLDRGFNYIAETHDPQTEPLLVVGMPYFSLECRYFLAIWTLIEGELHS